MYVKKLSKTFNYLAEFDLPHLVTVKTHALVVCFPWSLQLLCASFYRELSVSANGLVGERGQMTPTPKRTQSMVFHSSLVGSC